MTGNLEMHCDVSPFYYLKSGSVKNKDNGFTLVELLIVLLIIGVLLGVTLLSPVTGTTQKTVQEQSSRLQVLFAQIRDKALLDNAEYGFSVDESTGRYRWWVLPYEDKEWQGINEKPFQSFKLPDSLNVHLETGEEGLMERDFDEEGPSVVFYSDYQATPFSLYLAPKENKKQSVVLQTDGLSDVEQAR